MLRIFKRAWLPAIFLMLAASVFSQTDNNDVQLRLSFANGKNVYRVGEPIRVILSFTAKQPGYKIQTISSPQTEKIMVSPADGVYDWRYRLNRAYSYDDYFAFQDLSDQPVTITIPLNDFVRFDKPGKYSAAVTTKRVYYSEPGSKDQYSFGKKQDPMTSNTLDFEIKEMSETDEKEELKRLSSAIDSQNNWREQDAYTQELSFLTGDASTIEKVRRYLSPGNNITNYRGRLINGLYIARNKTLAIKLLEDALHDLNREPEYELMYVLSNLRALQEDETALRTDQDADSKEYWEQRTRRATEIGQNYLDELIESLPRRTGKSLTTTAITIFMRLPQTDTSSEAFNATKAIILNHFDELHPYSQPHLLETFWEKLKTPQLISSLEKILSRKPPVQYLTNSVALKRLIELDKTRARPFVIAEILNPESFVEADVLGALDEKFLPEVDDALLAQIREIGQLKKGNRDNVLLRIKTLVAARYASSKIYDGLMEVYKTNGDKWFEESRIALLGYFAQHNDKEAVSLIEERIAKSGKESLSNMTYIFSKIPITKGIENLFRKYLESNDSQAAGASAYYLSRYGGKENKRLIENRYNRWLKLWKPRQPEFEKPGADRVILTEKGFQSNLVESLLHAKTWKLTDKERDKLKESCFSKDCLRYFPPEKLP